MPAKRRRSPIRPHPERSSIRLEEGGLHRHRPPSLPDRPGPAPGRSAVSGIFGVSVLPPCAPFRGDSRAGRQDSSFSRGSGSRKRTAASKSPRRQLTAVGAGERTRRARRRRPAPTGRWRVPPGAAIGRSQEAPADGSAVGRRLRWRRAAGAVSGPSSEEREHPGEHGVRGVGGTAIQSIVRLVAGDACVRLVVERHRDRRLAVALGVGRPARPPVG
jgi:hypothetical protein